MDALGLTILIVDPDPVIHDGLTTRLENEGFSVSHATTGRDALLRMVDAPPTLVISEIDLPDISGAQLIFEIRQQNRHQACTFYTSNTTDECYKAASDIGAAGYLPKAIPFHDVVSHVILMARRELDHEKTNREMTQIVETGRLKERLVGRFAEHWRIDEDAARTLLVSFVRSQRMTFKELSDSTDAWAKEERRIRDTFERLYSEAIPRSLRELEKYYVKKSGHKRRDYAVSPPTLRVDASNGE